MTTRRALVVDDSRSARAFLTRLLERYGIAVDGVESAEQAIDYLRRERPDVIFMDHLMPGMDGFQAVQAIKNDPHTATIPIMMYTSQEGELYLSQARALGAIGVLPKQIKHADVTKALEQLKLLDHSRSGSLPEKSAPIVPPPTEDAIPVDLAERRGPGRPGVPALPPDQRAVLEGMLGHHVLELRRFVTESLETQSDRILGDVRLLLQDHADRVGSPRPARRSGWTTALLTVVTLASALSFAALWWAQRQQADTALQELARTRQLLRQSQRAEQASDPAAAPAGAQRVAIETAPQSLSETVPFGELPLAGARLDRVAALLAQLNTEGFRGAVQVRSIPGRFCMTQGPNGALAPAADALPFARCDQVGNPREDNGSPSERQSVAFANMIALMRTGSDGRLDVQVSAGGPDEVAVAYPAISDGLTAGEWNRAAVANNRIEVRWQAAR